jgi:serine/threonine protein kinase
MLLGGKYRVETRLGQGAFGVVYKGKREPDGKDVVIKTEPADIALSTLKHETTIMNWLYSKHCRHIPPVYWYGVFQGHRALVMPFYSRSVEQYAKQTVQETLFAVNSIMRSAVRILQEIHSKFVIHRDLKPANWMIDGDRLVLIDFGLATFYVDEHERHVLPPSASRQHIVGTPKFVSWHVHDGCEPSRRDDMISLGYMGLYMLTGNDLWRAQAPESTTPTTATTLEPTHVEHPMNARFKTSKTLENLLPLVQPVWPGLAKYFEATYSLGYPEHPSYDEYVSFLSET